MDHSILDTLRGRIRGRTPSAPLSSPSQRKRSRSVQLQKALVKRRAANKIARVSRRKNRR